MEELRFKEFVVVLILLLLLMVGFLLLVDFITIYLISGMNCCHFFNIMENIGLKFPVSLMFNNYCCLIYIVIWVLAEEKGFINIDFPIKFRN